jgi:hypothetical protein
VIQLLRALVLALPFIAMRDVYSTLSTFLDTSFRNSLTAKVVLSTMPEMVVVAILVVAGIMTRDVLKEERYREERYKNGSTSS